MPIVPTVQGRQVESRGVQTGGFQAFDQPNITDALVGAGQQALNVFGEAKQKANVAMAQNASLKLSQTEEELKTQLYGLQGQNALGKGHEFTQKYNEQVQTLSDSLPDDASRQMFMQQARLQQIQFQGNVNRYEIGQINSFENDQVNATRKLQIQKEADAWDNPQEAALA
ncbi:lytic transglycosylase, partial [Klebsiella pneumoniae]|nr:lytic transglycosylase [Klebsiella pneumoniae]